LLLFPRLEFHESASEGSAMQHRNDDDNYSRRAREWDRDRDRHGDHEGRESSFHPGGYGFDDTSRSEREYSPQYGQREPYATSGSGGGSYGATGYGEYRGEGQGGPHYGRDAGRTYSPQDYSRDYGRDDGRSFGRDDWGRSRRDAGGYRQSRYSESQYGQHQYDPGRNWSAGRGNYGSSPDWDAGDRSPRYGREPQRMYGAGYRDEDYSYGQRYGVGYSGSQSYGHERPLGDERFNRADQPRYFGTGYAGEGTSAFGGGFGEERWRSQPASYGRFGEAEHSSRFHGGGSEQERGSQRPGLLRRLFGTGPKGYQRSDERLREDISERLMQAGNLDSSEVTVNVSGGKVTLEGTVTDRYMKHAIEDLVDACPGVQDIDNRIRVDRSMGGSASGSTTGTGTAYGGGTGASTGGGYGASSSTGSTGTASGTASGGSSATTSNRTTRKDS
jgi:BON domain